MQLFDFKTRFQATLRDDQGNCFQAVISGLTLRNDGTFGAVVSEIVPNNCNISEARLPGIDLNEMWRLRSGNQENVAPIGRQVHHAYEHVPLAHTAQPCPKESPTFDWKSKADGDLTKYADMYLRSTITDPIEETNPILNSAYSTMARRAVPPQQSFIGFQSAQQLRTPPNRVPLAPRATTPSPDVLNFGNLSLEDDTGADSFTLGEPSSHVRTGQIGANWPRSPSDLEVIYAKGKMRALVHKIVLVGQSKFFADKFKGISKNLSNITLRGVMPYSISAMLHFFYNGTYDLSDYNPQMNAEYHRTTSLDFHALVYTAGLIYDAPGLRKCAIELYLDEAHQIMAMDFAPIYCHQMGDTCCAPSFHGSQNPGFPIRNDETVTNPINDGNQESMPFSLDNNTVFAKVYWFINSITLIWKNTASRMDPRDEMRDAVLELVKLNLNKLCPVAAFSELVQNGDFQFGENLQESLGADGIIASVVVSSDPVGRAAVRFE